MAGFIQKEKETFEEVNGEWLIVKRETKGKRDVFTTDAAYSPLMVKGFSGAAVLLR